MSQPEGRILSYKKKQKKNKKIIKNKKITKHKIQKKCCLFGVDVEGRSRPKRWKLCRRATGSSEAERLSLNDQCALKSINSHWGLC
jgi:hypothetical protein